MAFDLGQNLLTVHAYEGVSDTQRRGVDDFFANAVIGSFSKTYPSGLYVSCDIFVPRDATLPVLVQGLDRLVIRNGQIIVWEGIISGIGYGVGSDGEQGIGIEGIGAWGGILGQYTMDKRWADDRVSADVWRWFDSGNPGSELATDDRHDRLRVTPKAEAWAANEYYALEYSMPTGETIKRVTLSYDFQEGGQVWEWRLRDIDNAVTIWNFTSSGSGTQDDTLGTPHQTLYLQFISRSGSAQTPTADGTYYGEVSGVVVYSETGSINLTEVATDILGVANNINSETTYIDSNTFSLVPFYTNGPEAATRILERAAAYGDSSQNPWACQLIDSEKAASSDGTPVLKVAAVPDLSDYDYAVRLDEANVVGEVNIVRDFANIVNWVSVTYRDEASGRTVVVTPDDNANLTDSLSVSTYGERRIAQPLNLGNAGQTAAVNYGRRFLAENKDPKWIMASSLTIVDSIRSKTGAVIPVSQVEPGKRIRVENFLQDLSSQTDGGLTFLITDTTHYENGQSVSISAGQSNNLAVMLSQIAFYQKAVLQNVSAGDRSAASQ